jgi:hypothetical protein
VSGESSLVVWESADGRDWLPILAMTDTRPLLGPTVTKTGPSLIVTAEAVSADRTTTVVYTRTLEPMTLELIAEFDGQLHTAVPGRNGLDLFTTNQDRGTDLWHLPYR